MPTIPPLTSEHLREALAWSERASEEPQPLAEGVGPRRYRQREWDCGTACCLHGAAHLIALGVPASCGPSRGDYADLPAAVRDGVISVLSSTGGTPELLRRVLEGDVTIGRGLRIDDGVTIGDGATIGRRVTIGYGVTIGDGATIGDGVCIADRVRIGYRATIGYRVRIGYRAIIRDSVTIGDDVIIRRGASIDDDV